MLWEKRNCSLPAISPFPTVFSRLKLQTHKNQGLFGKGLTFFKKACLQCLFKMSKEKFGYPFFTQMESR